MRGMVGVSAGETALMADHLELLEDLDQRDISSHLLSKIKHAQLLCRAALEEELDRLGLTVTQFLALAFIDEHGAEISSAELARRSYVSPQAMMTGGACDSGQHSTTRYVPSAMSCVSTPKTVVSAPSICAGV